jgi:twinkle protein
MSESEYMYKTSCDNCGSSDANAVYSDGGKHCFSCGKHCKSKG